MAVASTSQICLPLGDSTGDAGEWSKILFAAFADRQRDAGFLPLAEQAARARNGGVGRVGQATSRPKHSPSSGKTKLIAKPRVERSRAALPPAQTDAAAVAAPPGLPRIEVDIPFSVDVDLAPLLAATSG